jgi:RES domain
MSPVEVAHPPSDGVWRVGRAPDPLVPSPPLDADDLDNPRTGNRFDSPLSNYQALYFATTLDGCYGETLARFRPDVDLPAVVGSEWQDLGFMGIGEVPADWRQRRLAVRVTFPPDPRFDQIQFLNVDSGETREVLRQELARILAFYGYADFDAGVVHAQDRRITRWIGQWAYGARDDDDRPVYAGVRYTSRLDPSWECWAVFQDVSIAEIARHPVLLHDEALQRVAQRSNLRVF